MWKKLKNLLFPEPPIDVWEAEKKWREEEYNPMQQKMSDDNWDRKIQREAERLFEEWKGSKVIGIGGKQYNIYIPLVNFNTGVYMIYNNDTARYGGDKAHKKVMELYNKMIEDYENTDTENRK